MLNTQTKQPQTKEDSPLIIAGQSFASRFLLGTGKFKRKSDLTECIETSGSEVSLVFYRFFLFFLRLFFWF